MSELESAQSFTSDTHILFEAQCTLLLPGEDGDDDFPIKTDGGVAVLCDVLPPHAARILVFKQGGGGVVFESELEPTLLSHVVKAIGPATLRFTRIDEAHTPVDLQLADANMVHSLVAAVATACFKQNGCVQPIAFAFNKRESRRHAQIPVGNVVELAVPHAVLLRARDLEKLGQRSASEDVVQVASTNATPGDSQDLLELLLSDANEHLLIAAACDVANAPCMPWAPALVPAAADADARESAIISLVLEVRGSYEADADAEKEAIKKRLQRQGAASVLDAPTSQNASFAMAAAAAMAMERRRGASQHDGRSMDDIPIAAASDTGGTEEPTSECLDAAGSGGKQKAKRSGKASAGSATDPPLTTNAGPSSHDAAAASESHEEALQRVEAKLERRKQRLVRFEADLAAQAEQLRTAEQQISEREAALKAAEAALRVSQQQIDADREVVAKQEATVRRREKDAVRADRNSERAPLIARGGTNAGPAFGSPAGAEAYVYKIEQNFFDNSLLPDGIFTAYPLTAWYVHITTRAPAAATLLALALAGIGMSATHFVTTWPAIAACVLCGAAFFQVFWRRKTLFDQLHVVEQSCLSHSDPVEVNIYPFGMLFATLPLLLAPASLASAAIVVVDVNVVVKVGLIVTLCTGGLMLTTAVLLHTLAALTCYERVAQTVPTEHGALTSRISLRASLARYQYLKRLVHTTSTTWSPITFNLLLLCLFAILFAVYNATLRRQDQLVAFSTVLLSTSIVAGAALLGCVLIAPTTRWDLATRCVIAAVGTHFDRWARGDLNHTTDARAEDFVTLQTALWMAVRGGGHARWALRLPFARQTRRHVELPAVLLPLTVILALAGVALLPVVAVYHVDNFT